MNTIKPKYNPDYVFPEPEEEEDEVIYNLRKNEWQSGEHQVIDYKTKEVVTMREFVLQELIEGKEREKQMAGLQKCAKLAYDIREDVRGQIRCDMVKQMWSEHDSKGFKEKQAEEQDELNDKKRLFATRMQEKV